MYLRFSFIINNQWYWHRRDGIKRAMPLPSGVEQWIKKGQAHITGWGQCSVFPSVLCHSWLGDGPV